MQSRQGQEKNKFRNASNIHQLYQDLFITDMKDEIAVASNEVVQLRQELLEKDNQNQMLKKQNSELKSKVKCYRKLVADLNKEVKGGMAGQQSLEDHAENNDSVMELNTYKEQMSKLDSPLKVSDSPGQQQQIQTKISIMRSDSVNVSR